MKCPDCGSKLHRIQEGHHLTVFSFNYCPLCVIERQKERERKVEPKSEGKK